MDFTLQSYEVGSFNVICLEVHLHYIRYY